MAAPVSRRFFSPHNVQHGTNGISTVRTITYRKNWTRLAGQGDADLTDSFQAKVNLQVSGTIVVEDPIQADALIDAPENTLSWDGATSAGGTPKHVAITGVSFFTLDETDAHNSLDGVTLGWNAFNPTGADPVTVGMTGT
jgi:hypothetical protein